MGLNEGEHNLKSSDDKDHELKGPDHLDFLFEDLVIFAKSFGFSDMNSQMQRFNIFST